VDQAHQESVRAAEAAGVVVRSLHTPEQMQRAAEVLAEIWAPGGSGEAPVEAGLLVALEHAGNYVAGAYADDQLIGATVGFFGAPDARTGRSQMMHSHIAGVLPSHARGGVGAAMKLHQRAWCLDRGITVMEWTFDPLIARNARFNLHKLGARFAEYLPQFYGEMRDGINAGQGSDRALIQWYLEAPEHAQELEPQLMLLEPDDDAAPRLAAGEIEVLSAAGDAGVVGLRVPTDMMALRADRPNVAARWRTALREVMVPLMRSGWTVTSVRTDGTYLLTR
jgi:predicted GNAT superfamily acetyltransferase